MEGESHLVEHVLPRRDARAPRVASCIEPSEAVSSPADGRGGEVLAPAPLRGAGRGVSFAGRGRAAAPPSLLRRLQEGEAATPAEGLLAGPPAQEAKAAGGVGVGELVQGVAGAEAVTRGARRPAAAPPGGEGVDVPGPEAGVGGVRAGARDGR